MCGVLPAHARLRLASSLLVAGRPPALLPADLATLPLPSGSDERADVCRAIEGGLDRRVLAQLAEARLADLVPPLAGLGGAPCDSCPARLHAVLERQGVTTWRALGGLTLGEVAGWSGVGGTTVAAVIGMALAATIDGLAVGANAAGNRSAAPVPAVGDDFAVLAEHERDTGGSALRLAVEGFAKSEYSPAVRAAAERLLTEALTPPTDLPLITLDRLLEGAGDTRDRGVFEYRTLRLGDQATLAELASALELSQERIRQLRARAEGRVRAAFAAAATAASASAASTLTQAVTTVAERLGVAAPVAAVEELLTSLHLPPLPDSRSLLVLWRAGPYRPVPERPGWLATEPATLVAETTRLLHEDGGVREAEHVAKELEAFGVAPEYTEAWLAGQPARMLEGLLVATSGAPLDVAERALSAAGRAMTVEELSAWARMPGDRANGDLRARLRRDRRFTRVDTDAFELAEWDGDPYEDGLGGGRVWLRVEVDADVLAGACGGVPVDLVQDLGLHKGARRTFATRYGPVALSSDGGPSRGSLRPVVLAAGAAVGDSVLLGFHPDDGDAIVEVVPSATAAGTTA